MILYHGSNLPITKIDLEAGKAYKDFGKGFYTTPVLTQATAWANRIAHRLGGKPFITEFNFDEEGARSPQSGLSIKEFVVPNKEWALFVMANRNHQIPQPVHSHDIVIGPVADDRMGVLFGLYELNLVDLEHVVKELTYRETNSQYFFHTSKSLEFLSLL